MKDEKFTYHETDSKDLLITQYKNKPNFKKLMGIVGKRTQNIENKLEVFYSRLNIDSMDGVNLDMIGNVLILERKGLSDNDYKFDLKIQIALLSSMGNTEDIINFISLVTGANRIYMKENFPASVGIFSNQSISDYLAEKIKKKIHIIFPAGVSLSGLSSGKIDKNFMFDAPSGKYGKTGFDNFDSLGVGGGLAKLH